MKRSKYNDIWPIDEKACSPPNGWQGWPGGKKFALVITHDVDTVYGRTKCLYLKDLEKRMGFKSSFNFVPERYYVSPSLRRDLIDDGFEVGVHGLYHDGKLFDSRNIYKERSARINHYLKKWGSVGFRSPAMHHNLEWIQDLNIEYDSSTFDTDPFEPQPDGVGTIFPFLVHGNIHQRDYVELPYTLPQDFTLFIILKEKSINIWKKKLDWIVEKGGMALILTHPDYMSFDGQKNRIEEYPSEYYGEFLSYVKSRYEDQYWHVLPKEMARFWYLIIEEKEF
jgi:hypothetical protein